MAVACARSAALGRAACALQPSRFLDELPAAELQRDGADPVADAERKQERATAGFAAIRALLES